MDMRNTILILLLPVCIHAQNFQIDKAPLPVDSLKTILPLLRDSARVDCLNELARSYAEVETPALFDSALLLVRQACTEAAVINYKKGLGDACFRYGHISQWWLWNFKEAEDIIKKLFPGIIKFSMMKGWDVPSLD
jgi:hypothetical protein